MAAVINVKAPDLTAAAAVVAQHIETAAKPATTAGPMTHAAASPVDAAAHSAAGAIRTKMAAMSAELAPKGEACGGDRHQAHQTAGEREVDCRHPLAWPGAEERREDTGIGAGAGSLAGHQGPAGQAALRPHQAAHGDHGGEADAEGGAGRLGEGRR